MFKAIMFSRVLESNCWGRAKLRLRSSNSMNLYALILAVDSLILLSRSFQKCVAAFVAPLSPAYFPIRALLARDRLRVSR